MRDPVCDKCGKRHSDTWLCGRGEVRHSGMDSTTGTTGQGETLTQCRACGIVHILGFPHLCRQSPVTRAELDALRHDLRVVARVLTKKLTFAEATNPAAFTAGIPYRRNVPWEDAAALQRIANGGTEP